MSTIKGWIVIISRGVEDVGLGIYKVSTVFCFLTEKWYLLNIIIHQIFPFFMIFIKKTKNVKLIIENLFYVE